MSSSCGRAGLCALVTALLAPWLAGAAVAQGPPPQPLQRPSEDFALPEPELAPEPPVERILPPVAPLAPQDRIRSGFRTYVKAFRFEGNTVVETAELLAAVAPFTERELAAEDLEAARERISRLYYDRGYVASGAVVPDQEMVDGVILLRIVEGELVEVVVEGTDAFHPSYFEKRLMRLAGRPLRIQDVERQLQVLEQDPLVRRLAARVLGGRALGEAVLRLRVDESLPFRVGAEYANDSPVVYSEHTGRIGVRHTNLTGHRDEWTTVFRATGGILDIEGQVRMPVNVFDTTVGAHVRYTDGEVRRGPFDFADVESKAFTAGVSVAHPLYRTRTDTFRVGWIGEWRRSKTELFGGFSFPGSGADPDNGVSKLTAFRFAGEWVHRTRDRVAAFRQLLSVGIPILDHTSNSGDVPDGRFFSALSQLRVALRSPALADTELVLRGDLQVSNGPLLPIEQIGVGGLTTVRGYSESEVVRDQAVIASAELRLPIYRTATRSHVLQLAPFVDYAYAWNRSRDEANFENETLASVGAGLRYRFREFARAELYYGRHLTDDAAVPSSAQGNGIHFRLRFDLQ